MKKIAFMLITLIMSLGMFGTVIVVYANRAATITTRTQATISATDQPTQPTVTPTSVPLQDGNTPEIALTIDDGPSPYTSQMLSVLRQYGIHATFFVVGQNVQNYPDLVQQELADGHLIGNHTWDHADLTKLSANAVRKEISDTSAILQQTAGFQPTFFRPPYGAITNSIQAQAYSLGLTSTLWSVDPQDWTTPGTQVIINRVLSEVQNGAVILMHDGGGNRSQSIAALKTIIPTLQQRGYHFVTVQQLANDATQTIPPPIS